MGIIDGNPLTELMRTLDEEPSSSLDFLQAVYRDAAMPLHTRMRAAMAALPFEHPKLAVTAIVDDDGSFAARLERAIARSQQTRTIPEVIEAVASEPKVEGEGSRARVNATHMVPDRRFRR